MAIFNFYTLLRLEFGLKTVEIDVDGVSIYEALKLCQQQTGKNFLHKLFDNSHLKTGTIILINGKNIMHLEREKTVVHKDDRIDIFPPGGGG